LLFNSKKRKLLFPLLAIFIVISVYVFSVDYVFDNVLSSHQQDRINELLGITFDPKGAGYNVNQSKIAIGSGGFLGKGFLEGTQTKFNFVPEQSTDFIFCTVGEEWGFLGSFVLITLFVTLFFRLIFLAERQRSNFSRIYLYCVSSILFFHFAINIGMTIGLAPVIGIPLPFFSYGGSSLWSFTLLLFVGLRLDAERKHVLR
jgi:rod shape determining protein RodA